MTNDATIQQIDNTRYLITGVLDFSTVIPLIAAAKSMLTKIPQACCIDFAGITQSNSAGLTFILALRRYAQQQKKSLQCLHLPEKLLAAAKISNLDTFVCTPTT